MLEVDTVGYSKYNTNKSIFFQKKLVRQNLNIWTYTSPKM